MESFYAKLEQHVIQKQSLLCVGLDPVVDRMPAPFPPHRDSVLPFLEQIIAATQRWAVAYKPNWAYFEALGPEGLVILDQVINRIPKDTLIIGDAKRGDVGHSASLYAEALFERFRCDAVTVNPYQGEDAVMPFLEYRDRGVFLLCLTSNPGAQDFQIPKLYLQVAEKAKEWNRYHNCGLVVGGTRPEFVKSVREASGPMPFLMPGIGAQGGDAATTLAEAQDGTNIPCLINASRSILYASAEEDFAEAAGLAAQQLFEGMRPSARQ